MIGVYDSGVGGLAVLRELRRLLPEADLVYLADQANLPYGERTLEEVRSLAVAAVGRLVDVGAETVVVACNTASGAGLGMLRERFDPVAIVGMEPALKPAAGTSRSGVIAVLATPTTFAAHRYAGLVDRFASGLEVVAVPCPGWAEAVEDAWPDGARGTVQRHLAPVLDAGADTIVLACTHYSFLAEVIGEIAGPAVAIVDPAPAVARQAARVAGEAARSGSTRYLTTGSPERFAAQIGRLLGTEAEVEGVG